MCGTQVKRGTRFILAAHLCREERDASANRLTINQRDNPPV